MKQLEDMTDEELFSLRQDLAWIWDKGIKREEFGEKIEEIEAEITRRDEK